MALTLALPWLVLAVYLVVAVRLPPALPPAGREGLTAPSGNERPHPSVSVVIPARNEAVSIENCVRSIAALDYPDFEIIVVDDRSEDGTGDLARAVGAGSARRLLVLEGAELPAGWLGKPWACHQGAQEASGDWLLFTDADTHHGTGLLDRAVRGAFKAGVEAVSVVGRQRLESFWERVVQPQMFVLLSFRFPRAGHRTLPPERWRDALAAGQYILVSRVAYETIGGHDSVRGEVVEDVRLAQELTRAGLPPVVRSAVDELATRMYRSLPEILEGWTKNVAIGVRHTVGPALRPFALPAMLLHLLILCVLPPTTLLVASVTGAGGAPLLLWSGSTTAIGLALWMGAATRLSIPAVYGAGYPLGALVAAWIVARSWIRGGRRVEWKGRAYSVTDLGEGGA